MWSSSRGSTHPHHRNQLRLKPHPRPHQQHFIVHSSSTDRELDRSLFSEKTAKMASSMQSGPVMWRHVKWGLGMTMDEWLRVKGMVPSHRYYSGLQRRFMSSMALTRWLLFCLSSSIRRKITSSVGYGTALPRSARDPGGGFALLALANLQDDLDLFERAQVTQYLRVASFYDSASRGLQSIRCKNSPHERSSGGR